MPICLYIPITFIHVIYVSYGDQPGERSALARQIYCQPHLSLLPQRQ